MGKYEKRGLEPKEIEFRKAARKAFTALRGTYKRLTYCMVLHVMRQSRKKDWTQERTMEAMKGLIRLRSKRLTRRIKKSAKQCSRDTTIPKSNN